MRSRLVLALRAARKRVSKASALSGSGISPLSPFRILSFAKVETEASIVSPGRVCGGKGAACGVRDFATMHRFEVKARLDRQVVGGGARQW